MGVPAVPGLLLLLWCSDAADGVVPDEPLHVHHHRLLHQHALLRGVRLRLALQRVFPSGYVHLGRRRPAAVQHVQDGAARGGYPR